MKSDNEVKFRPVAEQADAPDQRIDHRSAIRQSTGPKTLKNRQSYASIPMISA
jgi:hypothetical protein